MTDRKTEFQMFIDWCHGTYAPGAGKDYHALSAVKRFRMFQANVLLKRQEEKRDV